MLLIADSGSTKTDWKIVNAGQSIQDLQTLGFNPYLQTSDEIYSVLLSSFREVKCDNVSSVFFYGAGCSNEEKCETVKVALKRLFINAKIEVDHDLLGAARALCGKKEGMAAILGTGSNSCYYDGQHITEHVDSIGFYLGDEGSGCYLGKKLIQAYIYKELPDELEKKFILKYQLDKDAILKTVYQKPFPNRFLASFTIFLRKNIEHNFVKEIIASSFDEFFKHHITKYTRYKYVPLNCTGSVGFYFQDILKEIADKYEVQLGKNIKSPIEGLLEYHS